MSLAGGIGITALGPGGVLPTIGLFTLTDLAAPVVAGTALVTHVATGMAGTAAFTRSGQLRERPVRRTALLLCAAAALGTPMGVLITSALSQRAFGVLLAVIVAGVALLLWYRERAAARAGTAPPSGADVAYGAAHPGTPTVVGIGLAVAVASGIVGIGGPMLAVPLLIAVGVPVLESLAAAQAQSIVIAAIGSVGYAAYGAIDWPLALLIGIPELAGVFLGWRIARTLPTHTLKRVLIVVLLALAPYLAFTA